MRTRDSNVGGRPKKSLKDLIKKVNNLIKKKMRIVVVFGAGVSVAAGLPAFRSPGVLGGPNPKGWEKKQFARCPAPVRGFASALFASPRPAPTATHRWAAATATTIITTNIDGLEDEVPPEGGRQPDVVRLHGTARVGVCQGCGVREGGVEWERRVVEGNWKCGKVDCRKDFRPCVVLYGEVGGEEERERAVAALKEADVVVVVGSSGATEPLATLLSECVGCRVPRVFVNLVPPVLEEKNKKKGKIAKKTLTSLKRNDVFLEGDCQEICPLLVFSRPGRRTGSKNSK